MITFSVNERKFHEEDFKKIAHLLKELKDPRCDDYKRVAISNLVMDCLNGEMKDNIQSYSKYGEKLSNDEVIGKSRKQIGDQKVSDLRLDAPTRSGRGIELPDKNVSIEDVTAAKESREIHFKVFGIVEAHLNNLGISLFKVIDPLVDATLVETKTEIRNPRVEKKFESSRKIADQFVTKYAGCFADISVEPDGTTLTDDVILYLEQNSLIELVRVVFKDKLLWQRIKLSLLL
ncbi:hypothetical protein [Paenibacillus sp. DMB5]|uniref:hypothetical protein n=1 Tax=Paenibacillus sp. DMB5 TaxID=1780103 RepID=UPI00076BF659|nr:hypothetical protein [Paenibacillus sp. DMB5]KUP23105.1 hypothetical protein AWJ19_22775 [Paenibacillus sp. DMB5]